MLQMPHKTVTLPKTAEPPACIVSCSGETEPLPSGSSVEPWAAGSRRKTRNLCEEQAAEERRRVGRKPAAEPVGTVEQCGQNECLHQHDQQLPAQFDRLVLVDPHTPDGETVAHRCRQAPCEQLMRSEATERIRELAYRLFHCEEV